MRTVLEFAPYTGTGRYVLVSHNAALAPGASGYTIEVWFKAPNTSANQKIISKFHDAEQSGFLIGTYNGYIYSELYLLKNSVKTLFEEKDTGVLATETWTHIALVWTPGSSGTVANYINGSLVQTLAAADTSWGTCASDMVIGQWADFPFTGMVDEVRIWNTARSQSEIQTTKDSVLTGSESGLVALYRFDETSGTTAADSAGADNNGTLVNMSGTWASVPW